MLLVYPYFQLLPSYDILFWPSDVILSVRNSHQLSIAERGEGWTHFVISDSRMIRFISSTTVGETNTEERVTQPTISRKRWGRDKLSFRMSESFR